MNSAQCAHCGLPVGRLRSGRSESEAVYCCSGCAIMAAVLASGGDATERSRGLFVRLGLAAFFSANVMVLTLFLYSLEPSATQAPPAALALVRGLLLCFSLPVFAILAPPFLRGFAHDLRRLRFSMDSLIAISAGAAFFYSAASVLRNSGDVYFDTATMVLLLVTAGRLLEANAHVASRRAVRELMELQPPQARVWREEGWRVADAREVVPGERVRVLSGERIPVDGCLVAGGAAIDESMLTGEPMPAERTPRQGVCAGTLCLNGSFDMECSAGAAQSLVADIVRAVEEAQRQRSPTERLADRCASVLTPATVLLAAGAFLYWRQAGSAHAWMNGFSVLVVACPCALGIAIPMVNVAALSSAAGMGVLVRSAEAMERLAAVDTIAFDKTGTVTRGELEVRRVVPSPGWNQAEVLAYAAAAAAHSMHPVARAVRAAAERNGQTPEVSGKARELPGRGLRFDIDGGGRVLLGQRRWISEELGIAEEAENESAVVCAKDEHILGSLVLEDALLPEAAQAIAQLRSMGYRLALLSGDEERAAGSVAAALGIPESAGALLPHQKVERIAAWKIEGRCVAMAGDGINDTPALAAADVGIAVSNSTEAARDAAQVVLLQGSLRALPKLMRLARLTRSRARRNFLWTAAYNSVALCLACGGYLRPVWAAALMLASSVFVVTSAARIRLFSQQ